MSPRRLAAAACAALVLAAPVAGCGGTGGQDPAPAASTTPVVTGSPAQAEPSQTVDQFLQARGLTATPTPEGDLAVEWTVPDGWEVAQPGDLAALAGLPTDGARAAALGTDWAEDGDLTPQAVLTVRTLSGDVDPDELLARAPGALENLPLFEYGPETYEDVGGNPTYGLTGAYLHEEHGYLGVSQTTVLVAGAPRPHLVQLTIVWPTAAAGSVAASVREMNQSLTISG